MKAAPWLDRLPRSHLRLGDRAVPVYFFFGTFGLAVGFLIALFVALKNELSTLMIFGGTIAGVVLFIAHNFLRRRLTGKETIFQLEQLLVQMLFACVFFAAVGVPALAYTDAIASGLAAFVAFGRIGCLLGGCCYGPISDFGLRYPPECGAASCAHRRFPIQAVEIVLWSLLLAGAVLLALSSRPGNAVLLIAVGAGTSRLLLEELRADPLPRVFGVSYTRVVAVALIAFGFSIDPSSALLSHQLAALAGVVVVALLFALRSRWLAFTPKLDEASRQTFEELGREWRRADEVPISRRAGGWTAAMSRVVDADEESLLLSVSATGARSRAEAQIVFDAILLAAGLPINGEIERSDGGLFVALIPLVRAAEEGAAAGEGAPVLREVPREVPRETEPPPRRSYFGDVG